jgi:hypothetical protein
VHFKNKVIPALWIIFYKAFKEGICVRGDIPLRVRIKTLSSWAL